MRPRWPRLMSFHARLTALRETLPRPDQSLLRIVRAIWHEPDAAANGADQNNSRHRQRRRSRPQPNFPTSASN